MSSLWWTDPGALAATLARMGVEREAPPASPRLDLLPGVGMGEAGTDLVVARLPGLPGQWAAWPAPGAPEPAPPRTAPPFRPPAGELGGRLDAYLAWLAEAAGGRRAFVADRDGLPLAGDASEHDLMAIGSAVTRLVQRINSRSAQPLGAGVVLEVGAQRLQLVVVENDLGVFTVGMVVDRPPTPAVVQRLAEGLQAALRGG